MTKVAIGGVTRHGFESIHRTAGFCVRAREALGLVIRPHVDGREPVDSSIDTVTNFGGGLSPDPSRPCV